MNKNGWNIVGGIVVAAAIVIGIPFMVDWRTYGNMNSLKNEGAAKLKDVAAFEVQQAQTVVLNLPLVEAQLKQEDRIHVKGIAEAYKSMGQITIGANATAEEMQRFVDAKNKAGAMLSGFSTFLVANYPNLVGSSEAVKILMIENSGALRKKIVGYVDYNDIARRYENWRTGYFTSLSANRHGFKALPEIVISANDRKIPDTSPKMN